jgi:hypothetical protein
MVPFTVDLLEKASNGALYGFDSVSTLDILGLVIKLKR